MGWVFLFVFVFFFFIFILASAVDPFVWCRMSLGCLSVPQFSCLLSGENTSGVLIGVKNFLQGILSEGQSILRCLYSSLKDTVRDGAPGL